MSAPPSTPPSDRSFRELAHDVRNSIGAILSASELLERHYRPDGREARLFKIIFEEIDRLMKLVEARPAAKTDDSAT